MIGGEMGLAMTDFIPIDSAECDYCEHHGDDLFYGVIPNRSSSFFVLIGTELDGVQYGPCHTRNESYRHTDWVPGEQCRV